MKAQNDLFIDTEALTFESNQEVARDIKFQQKDLEQVLSMSVHWTFEVICQQIIQGNIELSPTFQRKNAWKEEMRSEYIESVILGFPIPPITLAEFGGASGKKKFVVIDGKQRLQTLIGFFMPIEHPYWKENKEAKLKNLKILKSLENKKYDTFDTLSKRRLDNAFIPVTVMYGFKEDSTNVFYEIFLRINTKSVPLNLQEIRQATFVGGFSNYLAEITNKLQPFQEVMGYTEPDERMNDTEYLLRVFANKFLKDTYKGDLAKFLDNAMKHFNTNWDTLETTIRNYYAQINRAIEILEGVFGGKKDISTISHENKRFNKALFEVHLFCFAGFDEKRLTVESKESFKKNLKEAFGNKKFSDLFTLGTNANYYNRFDKFQEIIDNSFPNN